MKVLALAGLMAVSATAVAADRSIVDLQYLPLSGTTYGFSEVNVLDATYKDETSRTEVSGYNLTQTFGHAFTDRFSLQGEISYVSQESENTYSDGTPSEKYDLTGISDPTVTAKFRMMDEDFRWDLIGGALISIGDTEIKRNGDMNNLQGGPRLFVGTEIGAKKENFQWSLLGRLNHIMKSTTDDKDGDEKYDSDAHNSLDVQASLLTKLSDISYIRTSFLASFTEEYDLDNDFTNPSTTVYVASVEYRHLFSQDLMLRLGVDKFDLPQSASGFSYYRYNAGLNYQF